MSDAQDLTTDAAHSEVAETGPLPLPHSAEECPKCFSEETDHDWWHARPTGSRLVGLVVAREGMPPVVQQRDDLARFGVPIEGFRHPAPEILESWNDRLTRLLDTLKQGDVLVVANTRALGETRADEVATIAQLRRRGIMVKVLSHHARHLADAARA